MATEKDPLPEQFRLAPGLGDEFGLLRTQVLRRLEDEGKEVGAFGTLDLLLMERASYLYSFIRMRESQGTDGDGTGFEHDRNYRDMFNMLISLLDKLKTTKSEEKIADEIRHAVVMEVVEAVRDATTELPPQLRRVVQDKLLELVER